MATSISRVLILGHSFIRRLREFISTHSDDFYVNFSLAASVVTRWHGVGGRTVAKTLQFDLLVVSSFRPDIVILQLGSNDLVTFRHCMLARSSRTLSVYYIRRTG